MRVVVKIIKYIIITYLLAFGLIALIFVMDKRAGAKFSNIRGYSFVVVDNDYLSPDIGSNAFVILKEATLYDINAGDYAYVNDGGDMRLKKIISIMDDGNCLTGYNTNNEKSIVKGSDIYAKKIFTNTFVSILFHILTSPITIVLMFVFLFFSGKMAYKRFES